MTAVVQYWVAVDVDRLASRPLLVGPVYGGTFSAGIYLAPDPVQVSVAGAIVASGPTPF